MRESLGTRLGWAGVQIVIVGLVWWFAIRSNVLAIGLIATIVLSTVVAPRWSNVVSGLGLVATAAAVHLYHGLTQMPMLLGGVGVLFALMGAYSLWASRRRDEAASARDDRGVHG